MSDAADHPVPAANQADTGREVPVAYWPDETVDMLAALIVVTCLLLGVLHYVAGG